MREVVVDAVIHDPYDGLMRLLGDAQRFGFELRAVTLAEVDGVMSAAMTLSVPTRIDAQFVAARLARHPVVQRVDVQEKAGRSNLNCRHQLAA
jgi:hypothetical protein